MRVSLAGFIRCFRLSVCLCVTDLNKFYGLIFFWGGRYLINI